MADWASDLSFRNCLERLEWESQRLAARDKEWRIAKQVVRAQQDKSSRADRAFSFVFVAGALEDLFRDLNSGLPQDLQEVAVRPHDLRPTALTMLMPRAWDLISSDRVLKMSKRRGLVDVANNFYTSADPIDLSAVTHLGLDDGRTVKPDHFEALWEGLCLSPTASTVWISDRHRQAIVSLGEKRNAIAHFETDPREEAFRYTYGDLGLLVDTIIESVERLHEHTIIWLDRFRRPSRV